MKKFLPFFILFCCQVFTIGAEESDDQSLEKKYEDLKFSHERESEYFRTQIYRLRAEIADLQSRDSQPVETCEEEKSLTCYRPTPFCFSGFSVYSNALYWTPTYSGAQYATLAPQPTRPQEVAPGSDWGYSVGAALYLNCHRVYLAGDYYSYEQNHSESVTDPGNIIPIFSTALGDNFDFASGKVDSHYRAVDITLGYQWLSCCQCKSYVFAGARYVRIKEKENYLYLDPDEVVPAFQRYTFNGWGPRVGVNFNAHPFSRCRILNRLGVNGQFGAMAAITHSSLLLETTLGGLFPTGILDFPTETETLFGFDLKLDLSYSICLLRLNFLVQGGYEIHFYENARKRIPTTNLFGSAVPITSSLGYGGPFVGLTIGY